MLNCPRCAQSIDPAAFLARATSYGSETDSGVSSCPACTESLEFRIAAEHLELGFTYWAGSLHFEALSRTRVPGLRLLRSPEGTAAELAGTRYPLAPS